MGLFRRLFSTDYRRAVAAEAQGDYLSAARYFALCGETEKVADMHLARARAVTGADERVQSLRAALDFTPPTDSRRAMTARLLALAIRTRGEQHPAHSEDQTRDLREAAQLFEEGQHWELAGDCHRQLGDVQRAADCYSRAGLVDQVERVLSQQEVAARRRRQEDQLFGEYELLLAGGQRDQAAETLRRCIEVARAPGEYRQLLAQLESHYLAQGRVTVRLANREVTIVGHFPMVVGRDADCDMQTRGPSVSRRHAHFLWEESTGFAVADCGSKNGTQLNQLPLAGTIPLPEQGVVGLGDSCQLEFEITAGAASPLLRLSVTRGMDQGKTALLCADPVLLSQALTEAPPLHVFFFQGKPFAKVEGQPFKLNGSLVHGQVQLLAGDQLELAGQVVQVEG